MTSDGNSFRLRPGEYDKTICPGVEKHCDAVWHSVGRVVPSSFAENMAERQRGQGQTICSVVCRAFVLEDPTVRRKFTWENGQQFSMVEDRAAWSRPADSNVIK